MMRAAAWTVLIALAGCPKQQAVQQPPSAQGAGCPSAAGVFVASFVTQEAGKGRSGWVLPMHAMKVEPGAAVPDYATIDAATAQASGVPEAPAGTLWLVTAAGAPCRGKVAGYYAAKIEGPPASISYGFELDGCAPPAHPEEAGGIVLATERPPTGCRFETPQPAAARLGEMDANKQWQRPITETPIPPALVSLVPPKQCTPPACEMLWAFGEVRSGNQPVAWTGAVNWLTVGEPARQCSWPTERFSGVFVPSGAGAIRLTDGGEHSHVLTAVLADSAGPKVILTEGPGTYATYDVAAAGATLGRSVTWMLAPAQAWDSIDHLGPECGPESPH